MLNMRSPQDGSNNQTNFGMRGLARRGYSSGCVDRKLLGTGAAARFSHSRRVPSGNRTVIFAFESKSLREVCEDESRARGEYDADVVEALKHRLADLLATTTGKDIIAGHPTTFGSEGEYMSVDLGTARKLIFAANHVKKPLDASKRVDWSKVTRIKFLRIESADA
jgi:hypothetical protein